MSKKDRYTNNDEINWIQMIQLLDFKGELFSKYEEGNSY